MKSNFKTIAKTFLLLVTIILSTATITSCSPDDGAPGPAGTNGRDGTDGVNASANTGFHVGSGAGGGSGQIISNATYIKVAFNQEITDDLNAFNPVTSELSIQNNGFYHLNTTVSFSTALPVDTPIILQLRKNGTAFKSFTGRMSYLPSVNLTADVSLSVGDVITVYVFQNSGSNKNLDELSQFTFFTGYKVY